MVVGFDYWNTLTRFPSQFKKIALGLKATDPDCKIVIISAVQRKTPKHEYEELVRNFCKELEFPVDAVEVICWDEHFLIPELKWDACRRYRVEMFYDDREDVCKLLSRRGIMALWVAKDAAPKDFVSREMKQGKKTFSHPADAILPDVPNW